MICIPGPVAPHRCAALDTFEAMLASGCRPHAAVYSSIIDVLWQTGIAWAQAKALHLFTAAVQCVFFTPWHHTVTSERQCAPLLHIYLPCRHTGLPWSAFNLMSFSL